jgi:hypothetical protein
METSRQSHQPATSGETSCRESYDEEYRFGRTPRVSAPCPFSTHQFARLLVLRSRIRAGLFGADDLARA